MTISDILLSPGMRSNLLSLKRSSSLRNQTQERLATGKKVNSPLDNPTNYFAATAATNRASDLQFRKDGIFESVQMISAADNGVKGITSLIEAAKGLVSAALSTSSTANRSSYYGSYQTILDQIDSFASDSSYRGTNFLINDSHLVEFSETTGTSNLRIDGIDATSTGLGLRTPTTATFNVSNVGSIIGSSVMYITTQQAAGSANLVTHYDNSDIDTNTNSIAIHIDSAFIGAFYITGDLALPENTFFADSVLTEGPITTLYVGGVAVPGTDYTLNSNCITFNSGKEPAAGLSITYDTALSSNNPTVGPIGKATKGFSTSPISVGSLSDSVFQQYQSELDSAISTVRTFSKNLSSNNDILNTRSEFVSSMVNVLETGADNLTLADMNEEGAKMLMLQTRQSLSVASLNLASQSSQSILKILQP